MRSVSLLRTAIALGCLSPLACAQSAVSSPIGDLVNAVAARNEIAHGVAAAKYPLKRPVEDPAREAQVLARKRESAQALGLDPDAIEQFYRQLIEANKLVQYLDYHRFALGETPPAGPDLDELRLQIDAVDADLLALWPSIEPLRSQPDCGAVVAQAVQRHDGRAQTALVRAVVGLCPPPRP